ncbi:MAG: thiamine diphosphokinase [Anaerovoracaceae bacterium]|jgi:thiamine pyrophosphokinase
MKECIIITPYIEGDLRKIINQCPDLFGRAFVVCADSGYISAGRAGLKPDMVIGDYDSLGGEPPEDITHLTFPVHKDYTDTGLCLDWALENGYTDVTIIGGLGGRLDHTISNIQDIAGFTRKGMRISIRDEFNFATVIDGPGSVTVKADILRDAADPGEMKFYEEGPRVGLFSIGDKVSGITSTGVEYPLTDASIDCTFPIGSANPLTENEVNISIDKGLLLVTFSEYR